MQQAGGRSHVRAVSVCVQCSAHSSLFRRVVQLGRPKRDLEVDQANNADAVQRMVGAERARRIYVQTGGTARPSPSPFQSGPFEPEQIIGSGRVVRWANYTSRTQH
jgi:hypothetical protein